MQREIWTKDPFVASGISKYLTPDPIGLAGGINPYLYVLNDPINFIDPEGLSPMGWIVRLTRAGMQKIASLGSKSAAVQARRQGENVLAASRQQAKAIENAAFGGQDLLRHKGHDLPDGNIGRPHFQTEGQYGHTFWGAAIGVIGGLLDPFDAISGELASDDMLYPDGNFPENNCQK